MMNYDISSNWYEKEMDAPEDFEENVIFQLNENGELQKIEVPDDVEGEEV